MQATPPHYEDNSESFTQFMQLHIFKTNQLVLTKHSSIVIFHSTKYRNSSPKRLVCGLNFCNILANKLKTDKIVAQTSHYCAPNNFTPRGTSSTTQSKKPCWALVSPNCLLLLTNLQVKFAIIFINFSIIFYLIIFCLFFKNDSDKHSKIEI